VARAPHFEIVRSHVNTDPILVVLQALERELHEPKARGDPGRLKELLHPEFREFGRSGRSYTKTQVLESLLAESRPIEVHSQDFCLTKLADTVYLLTYRSAQVAPSGSLENHSNRSSVWRLEPVGWQMVFHQGTPTGRFA
jgi:hypothetical protein